MQAVVPDAGFLPDADKPLLRESTAPNGSYGTLDQRESLISRETTATANASVKLTKAALSRWKRKARPR